MRTYFYIGIAVAAVTLGGCTVGPNYKRPQIAVPASFRAPDPMPESQVASLADLKWFEVFRDPQLDDLIKVALVRTTICATPWRGLTRRARISGSLAPTNIRK